jgi:hypothetical protein
MPQGVDPMAAGGVPQQGAPVDPRVARIQAAMQMNQMKQLAQSPGARWRKDGQIFNPR